MMDPAYEEELVECFRMLLRAAEFDKSDCLFDEDVMEYGRPRTPQDPVRGPRDITITLRDHKMTVNVRRPKFSPVTGVIGISRFNQEYDLIKPPDIA